VFVVLLVAAFALGACSRPAHAQVPADSTTAREVVQAPRQPRGPVDRPWHHEPWAIMMRSALVPGWGQATNGKWVKAGAAAGAEGWAIARLVSAWGYADQALEREADALAAGDAETAALARNDYNEAYDKRATAAWILAAMVGASMLDAYVDAHFEQFDTDFGPDPRLPDDATGQSDVYLGLRLAFRGP
jgi:hypothetical protein